MIFRQYEAILRGDKTETRRLVQDGDHEWICGEIDKPNPRHPALSFKAYSSIHAANGRVRFKREQQVAIVPKRGAPGLWHKFAYGELFHSLQSVTYGNDECQRIQFAQVTAAEEFGDAAKWRDVLDANNYQPSRIQIVSLHRELLHDITEPDAIAEGVASVAEYRDLWQAINGKTKGARWEDNPAVYVIRFKVMGGSLKGQE